MGLKQCVKGLAGVLVVPPGVNGVVISAIEVPRLFLHQLAWIQGVIHDPDITIRFRGKKPFTRRKRALEETHDFALEMSKAPWDSED
jgi:hypothetical protein